MSECFEFPNGMLCVGGEIIRIDTAKGVVGFEWHSYCGPLPVSLARGRVGDERKLPPNHPFWDKVTRWCEQGRIVRDGWAVMPPKGGTDAGQR